MPAIHVTQAATDVAPTVDDAVPAAQLVHEPAAAALQDPALHILQAAPPVP